MVRPLGCSGQLLQSCGPQEEPEQIVAAKPNAAGKKIEAVVNLAKRRGLVYPCGEIYGGTK